MKADAPNIVLITVDCLRFDHLGCYGYNQDITPNIDDLASRGTLFLQAVSNGGHTSSAFPSILASALPPLDKAEDREIMRRSTTLAEVLKEAGYHTAGFHSNPNLAHPFNYGKGFDTFEDSLGRVSAIQKQRWRLEKLKESKFGRSAVKFLIRLWWLSGAADIFMGGRPAMRAGELTAQVIEWLGAHQGRFFFWLHYMDGHIPYMPLPQYLGQLRTQPVSRRRMVSLSYKARGKPSQLSSSELATLIDLYDAEIRWC
jgi:arylsulfatase A-like enzyme